MDNTTPPPAGEHRLPTLDQLRAGEERYYAKKRGEKKEPVCEATRAYMQRIKAIEAAERDTSIAALMGHAEQQAPRRRFMPYPYTPDEAYPLALRIYERRLAAVGRRVVWDGHTEAAFRELVRYFCGDASGRYDIGRGIYLFGGLGAGKTIIMQAMQELARTIEERLTSAEVAFTPRSFRFGFCRDIAHELQRTSRTDSLRAYFSGTRLFDDLGNEEEKKIYGNSVNAMAEILIARYNAWQASGLITHCTSNLPPHDCAAVYGDRIGSRVFELFNHVYLDGRDKRMA
jgi:ATPase subunit of ABC transporter with duplicated ATPase domains